LRLGRMQSPGLALRSFKDPGLLAAKFPKSLHGPREILLNTTDHLETSLENALFHSHTDCFLLFHFFSKCKGGEHDETHIPEL
jgi:hypothetical protein